METGQDEVDTKIAPEHGKEASNGQPCCQQGPVLAGGESDVDENKVDDPGDEGPSLFGVKCPPSSPRMVGPPATK